MTIYVDDFHTTRASLVDGVPMSNMIATEPYELHKFGRKIGATPIASDRYLVDLDAFSRAVLLGAILVDYQTLAAMYSLHLLGENMEPAATARARRRRLAIQ